VKVVDRWQGLGGPASTSATVIDLTDSYVPDRRRSGTAGPLVVFHRPRQWSRGMVLVAVIVAMMGVVAGLTTGRLTSRAPSLSPLDRGFLDAMLDHHDETVRLASAVQARSDIGVIREDAAEIVARHRYENGVMETMLADAGYQRHDANGIALTWIEPGTSSPSTVSALTPLAVIESAHGATFDRLYLNAMRARQKGGIDLASFEAEQTDHPVLHSLALTIESAEKADAEETAYLLHTFGFE
jgi:uncharacterized protein (DUF305 family)